MARLKRDVQQGMALLMSLVFMLLLSLIGVSSMQNATLQEKMAGSVMQRNQSFQRAEAALRVGEHGIQGGAQCAGTADCPVPVLSGGNGDGEGAYEVDVIGATHDVVNLPAGTPATLYRVTAVGVSGHSRTVLESIYATFSGKMLDSQADDQARTRIKSTDGSGRRIMWRQIQ